MSSGKKTRSKNLIKFVKKQLVSGNKEEHEQLLLAYLLFNPKCDILKFWTDCYYKSSSFKRKNKLIQFMELDKKYNLIKNIKSRKTSKNRSKNKFEDKIDINLQIVNSIINVFEKCIIVNTITTICSNIFAKVTIYDIFEYNKLKEKSNNNYSKLVDIFKRIITWTQLSIICDSKNRRAQYINFIELATQFMKLRNYLAVGAIYCGLISHKVTQLTKNIILSKKYLKKYASIEKLMNINNNFECYRYQIKKKDKYFIPYVPVVNKDAVTVSVNEKFVKTKVNKNYLKTVHSTFWDLIEISRKCPYKFSIDKIFKLKFNKLPILTEKDIKRVYNNTVTNKLLTNFSNYITHASNRSIQYKSQFPQGLSDTSINSKNGTSTLRIKTDPTTNKHIVRTFNSGEISKRSGSGIIKSKSRNNFYNIQSSKKTKDFNLIFNWSINRVIKYLHKNDLAQYEQIFREKKIDGNKLMGLKREELDTFLTIGAAIKISKFINANKF